MEATKTKKFVGTPSPGSDEAVEMGCICKLIVKDGQEVMHLRNDCPVHWKEMLIGRVVQLNNDFQASERDRRKKDQTLGFLYLILIAVSIFGCVMSFRPF